MSREPEAKEGEQGVKGASPWRRTGERPPGERRGDDEDMLAVGPGEDPRGMGEARWGEPASPWLDGEGSKGGGEVGRGAG